MLNAQQTPETHGNPLSPSPSLPEDEAVEVSGTPSAKRRVALTIPPFWEMNPKVWFTSLEAIFFCNQINSDLQQYNTLVASLNLETVQDLVDVLETVPDTGKYEYLKGHVLSANAETMQKKLDKRLTGLELGTRDPSQLLSLMRAIAGWGYDDNKDIRGRWLDLLPEDLSKMLRKLRSSPLDELAEVADVIMDTWPACLRCSIPQRSRSPSPEPAPETDNSPLVAEMAAMRVTLEQLAATSAKTLEQVLVIQRNDTRWRKQVERNGRSRSRGKSPAANSSHCYFHQRFGAEATKCKKPCSYVAQEKRPSGASFLLMKYTEA